MELVIDPDVKQIAEHMQRSVPPERLVSVPAVAGLLRCYAAILRRIAFLRLVESPSHTHGSYTE